jgi:hypothetical protein
VVAGPNDVVVARVRETPIYGSQVAAHGKATGLSPVQARDDLVDQELLLQEAVRRRLWDNAEVDLARRQAMVRRFVTGEFGAATARPEAIEPADARPVYDGQINYFRHGRMLRVWNVCTGQEQAQGIYQDVRAHPPRSVEDFRAIAERHGASAQMVFLEETSQAYQAAWRQALFAHVQHPGQILPPTHLPELALACTTHVAYCEEALAPRDDSFEQALPEIRQKIYEDWRRKKFLNWSGQLVRAHRIELHPEALPK